MEVHIVCTGSAIGGKERLALANLLASLGGVQQPLLLRREHPGGEVLGGRRLPALQVVVVDRQGHQEADQPAIGAGNAFLVRRLAVGSRRLPASWPLQCLPASAPAEMAT